MYWVDNGYIERVPRFVVTKVFYFILVFLKNINIIEKLDEVTLRVRLFTISIDLRIFGKLTVLTQCFISAPGKCQETFSIKMKHWAKMC